MVLILSVLILFFLDLQSYQGVWNTAPVRRPLCVHRRRRVCVPEVKIPNCVVPDCDVAAPLPRACERAWQVHLIVSPAVRSPRPMCFVDVPKDKLQSISRVSTADIMRAMSR